MTQRKKKREVRCLDFDRVQLLLAVFSRPSLGVKRSRKLPSRGGGQPVLVRFSTRWTMAVRASTKVKYEGWDKGLCIDRRGRTREGGRALLAEERTKRKNERGGRRKIKGWRVILAAHLLHNPVLRYIFVSCCNSTCAGDSLSAWSRSTKTDANPQMD